MKLITMKTNTTSRRGFIKTAAASSLFPAVFAPVAAREAQGLIITDIRVHIVKVNHRGSWVFIELYTNKGITGVGEASQGVKAVTTEEQQLIRKEIAKFYELVKGESPFATEQYRQRGWKHAAASRLSATAFSGIEQALWDIKGKVLDIPVHQLLGGKIRNEVKVYANINRATNERDSNGRRPAHAFQRNAEQAVKQGFKAIKLAPFDEMKPLPSTPGQIEADIEHAIACIAAVRRTIGDGIDLLVDVHSHLDEALGIRVARQVEPFRLFWFEEAVNPQRYVQATKAITDSTSRNTAGGESIFGREGFAPLIDTKALDILMPDVKHCGGIQELRHIAAHAETYGLHIAPHNPSGSVATAATVQTVAGIPNFTIVELAHGEVEWRAQLIHPAEEFNDGYISVSDQPGIGHTLNHALISTHS